MAERETETGNVHAEPVAEPVVMDWGSGDTGSVTSGGNDDHKRKGPKLRVNPMKRQNSAPNISEIMSSGEEKKKPKTFTDLLLWSFRDKTFVKGVVPLLNDMMQPLTQNAISCAVKSAVNDLKTSVVDKMIESNKTLQGTVTKQSEQYQNRMKQLKHNNL